MSLSMPPRPRCGSPLALAALLALAAPLAAQGRGDYMNVESPQVSPITHTVVGGHTVLLVCNTPDNSIEVWDIDGAAPQFVQRLPVGLEPVSVLVEGSRFWTANFLGDSVTAGELVPTTTSVHARVKMARNLPAPPGYTRGDEPTDLAFLHMADTNTDTLLVTLTNGSAVAWIDATTLMPYNGGIRVPTAQNLAGQHPDPHALKEPRTVRVANDRVYALATKGGVTDLNSQHDLDVMSAPVGAALVFDQATAKLGSTNLNMRFASNGDLFVVGGEANNLNTQDKDQVRTTTTGFVASTCYRLTPTTGGGLGTPSRRDLNLDSIGTVIPKTGSGQGLPVSMPTDLALLEDTSGVLKVYIAAMGNDRVCVLTRPGSGSQALASWPRQTIQLPASLLTSGPTFGPRGLALVTSHNRLYVLNRIDHSVVAIDTTTDQVVAAESFALTQDPTLVNVKQGRRFLYDAEISNTGFVSCASCHVDGRTDGLAWRLGDPNGLIPPEAPLPLGFIHSLAGTGTVSHVDSSGQTAVLGDVDQHLQMEAQATFDPNTDPVTNPVNDPAGQGHLDDKREMVTQTLQGLLNFEVDLSAQDLVTNAPYHWRGDKPSLRQFNEAFETLLQSAHDPTDPFPRGLSEAEMDLFEEFVMSITYPPNPKQSDSRTYSQTEDPDAFAGLRLFHEQQTGLGARSCVHCHSLPDGSNNRLTVFDTNQARTGFVSVANRQAIESAQLRGLFQREALLEAGGTTSSIGATVIAHAGLTHSGLQHLTAQAFVPGSDPAQYSQNTPLQLTSINSFMEGFRVSQPGEGVPVPANELKQIKQFVHKFDWGVGPVIGHVVFFDPSVYADSNKLNAAAAEAFAMMAQADAANAGVVAWAVDPTMNDTEYGFRWSPLLQAWVLEDQASTPTVMTTDGLGYMAAQRGATLQIMAVPLGSERRIASHLAHTPPPMYDLVPTDIGFVGLVPNTAYATVPSFVKNWTPPYALAAVKPAGLLAADEFVFRSVTRNFAPNGQFWLTGGLVGVDDVYARTVRLFQYGLVDGMVPAPGYGVPHLRHEAPRRFRVRGDSIMMGARLELGIPQTDPTGASPQYRLVDLPLHPVALLSEGHTVWETAVEVDPLVAYMLMLGGPLAPGVQLAIDETINDQYFAQWHSLSPTPSVMPEPWAAPPSGANPVQAPLQFDPGRWNRYQVRIFNPGSQAPIPSATITATLRMIPR